MITVWECEEKSTNIHFLSRRGGSDYNIFSCLVLLIYFSVITNYISCMSLSVKIKFVKTLIRYVCEDFV